MKSVLQACQPQESILQGTFNPEVFAAALGPVIQYYRDGESTIDSVYTDAKLFLSQATYPTEGLKQTLSSVFQRISGDQSAPSILRLETAFGGGKTHILIACTHIAYLGKDLAKEARPFLDVKFLPEPHSVSVVGIPGDEIPVNKTKGDRLIPYTLWGELAYQIGGKELYQKVKTDAESFAAPGKHFLESVLGGKKALIMLDELAQYATRLEAARPGKGADQLAAFLMALDGYAKTHAGISVIVTFAGASDAFAKQTERLTKLLDEMGNGKMQQDDAAALAERASKGTLSVLMRDATAVTPVQANEIASVLAKRLFVSIDKKAASEVAKAYADVYERNLSMLPEAAANVRFHERMTDTYPFHPTLIDFLNHKLALAPNFQGTRGVLRILAMTVRSLWQKKISIPLIHVSHIDLKNSAIADELLGRTGNSDLRPVLNADIGSVETANLKGGMSNAQLADERNPHPDRIPFYEMTWKTVFLNSLVGRTEGKQSKVFGVSQQDAVFQLATPLLAPSQIITALDEISESAFYLRCEDGKYFAHTEPTINSILARIRQNISEQQVQQKLKVVSGRLISDYRMFKVEQDVHYPQDIADSHEKPTVAVISLNAEDVNIDDMFQTKGDNAARTRQNTILLLVPKTANVIGVGNESIPLLRESSDDASTLRVKNIARQVLAIENLKAKPEAYGIAASKLQDAEFVEKDRERSNALQTVVAEMYNTFYYCGQNGYEKKELRTSGDEGGTTILEQILKNLTEAGKLVFSEKGTFGAANLKALAESYFFKKDDKASCMEIYDSFLNYRSWPMIADRETLEQLLREGVNAGCWVAYKRSEDPADTMPAELYSDKKPLSLTVQLVNGGYSIMTLDGAKKRGWTQSKGVPDETVKKAVHEVMATSPAVTVQQMTEAVQSRHANATEKQIQDIIKDMVQGGGGFLYKGQRDQKAKPQEIVSGFGAHSHAIQPDDVVISRGEAVERGWDNVSHTVSCTGKAGVEKLKPLLKNLGSLYTRGGAKSDVDELDISDMALKSGATIRVQISDAKASDMKLLDEFFQVLADVAAFTDKTEADIRIETPVEDCALVKKLKE